MKHRPLPHLAEALERRAEQNLLRVPPPRLASSRTFCANDYLGLAERPLSETAATAPGGAGASRLVCGDTDAHGVLEGALATWIGLPKALVFASGYAANVGTLATLLQPSDVVFSDRANHASLIDGMRLAKAQVVPYAHNDLAALESAMTDHAPGPNGRRWVVTESYFSMDGDGPDLPPLRALCDETSSLLVLDEAHAIGVFGAEGRGLADAKGIAPDVFLGTLGKAIGAQGAFVAGAPELIAYLWNTARSFVFSTGMSPALALHAADNVRRVRAGDALRERLHRNTARLREGMQRLGCTIHGHGPIVPWVIGEESAALERARALLEAGFHAQAIRPPTVPAGGARLRITTSAAHDPSDVDAFLAALEKVLSR